MEAAGEKAQMQEDIAAVAKRLFQRVFPEPPRLCAVACLRGVRLDGRLRGVRCKVDGAYGDAQSAMPSLRQAGGFADVLPRLRRGAVDGGAGDAAS